MSEQIQAIAAALEYIEGHLQENITVADIAATAGYSLYHFIRTFNQVVQHTPYDYLMRRRLAKAASELLQGQRRVIDIALDFQFNNHETFTRAFGRLFGMPPSEWRQQGFADPRLILPALGCDDLEFLNHPEFEPPKLVALDEIILAGLMAPLSADPEVIPSLWRNLRGALRGFPHPSGTRDFWSIRVPPPMPGESVFYLAAVKIPSLESAPVPFVAKILPAGDYLCLSQKNWAAIREPALTYLYHTFLPKSGLQCAAALEIEHFGELSEVLIPVCRPQPRSDFSPKSLE
jgi:AraC family transcriptional regulator